MKLENPRDLFLHEMSAVHTGETVTADLLGEMADMATDENVATMLRQHQQETQQQIANLEQCFRAIGETPQRVPCGVIEALRQELREFAGMNPSPQLLTMFVLDGALKVKYHEIAVYRGLVGKAMFMGDATCIQLLETNLLHEEETAGRLERFTHEMGRQMLATV